jgi:hypothetical protein
MLIADPTFTTPDPELTRSQIRIHVKEFKYFYDLSQKTRITDPGSGFSSIPDPGVKKPDSEFLIHNTEKDIDLLLKNYKLLSREMDLTKIISFEIRPFLIL